MYLDGHVTLLTVKRGIPPYIGELAFPGGYVDCLENAHDCVAREVLEETGLHTDAKDYEIFGQLAVSPNNHLLIFYKYKHLFAYTDIKDKLTLNKEVLGFEYVTADSQLCFPLHQTKLIEYFNLLSPNV